MDAGRPRPSALDREPHVRLTVRLPLSLAVRLHVQRVLTGRAVGEIVSACLSRYLEEQELGMRAGSEG